MPQICLWSVNVAFPGHTICLTLQPNEHAKEDLYVPAHVIALLIALVSTQSTVEHVHTQAR